MVIMKNITVLLFIIFFVNQAYPSGTNVYGLGIYDVRFDEVAKDQTIDYRFERRFDRTLLGIGPKEDNFFFLKPFIGFEYTGDNASYFISGIYLEDNLGQLINGKENNYIFTPSFGFGYYEDGSGKKLGNNIQFRTTIEFSYELKNKNRIGFSFGHISNANLGNKNPGVEIANINYQIPF